MNEFELRSQGQNRRWPICRRIRVGNAAANGATITHLYIANGCRGLNEERTTLLQRRGRLHSIVRCAGTNDQHTTLLTDATQFTLSSNVNEQRGGGQTQLHHGHEAMAPSENVGVNGMGGE